jgi:hypothetical protein
MFTSIRWAFDTVGLEWFPGDTQRALMQLRPGTFTAVRISEYPQLFVKRLTERAFQLGVIYSDPVRTRRRTSGELSKCGGANTV